MICSPKIDIFVCKYLKRCYSNTLEKHHLPGFHGQMHKKIFLCYVNDFKNSTFPTVIFVLPQEKYSTELFFWMHFS